jgi:hypothetical protein
MKTPAYICDCCGFAEFGKPFAKNYPVTLYQMGRRNDVVYNDICEGCVILLSRATEAALKIIQNANRETLQ